MKDQAYRDIQNKYKREWNNKPANIEKRREKSQSTEHREYYRKYRKEYMSKPENRERDRNRRKTSSYIEWEKEYRKRAHVIKKAREYHQNKYRYDPIFREHSKKRHQEWYHNKMKDPSYSVSRNKYKRKYMENPANIERAIQYTKSIPVIERRKKRYKQKMETESFAATMVALTQPITNKE
jgi:hypothetical protein